MTPHPSKASRAGTEEAARPVAGAEGLCVLGLRLVLRAGAAAGRLGVYTGQYCINTLIYFFLTWFPVYLVSERHMTILKAGFVAALPAVAGFLGGVLGGVISDRTIKSGASLSMARKTPIVGGYILQQTGSFAGALVFVGANAAVNDSPLSGGVRPRHKVAVLMCRPPPPPRCCHRRSRAAGGCPPIPPACCPA